MFDSESFKFHVAGWFSCGTKQDITILISGDATTAICEHNLQFASYQSLSVVLTSNLCRTFVATLQKISDFLPNSHANEKKRHLASGCVKQQKNAYIIMKAWADSYQLAVSSGSIAHASPEWGLRVLGSCNWAHITTTRQHQSQADGCCSVGALDTLANRALVKHLTLSIQTQPEGVRDQITPLSPPVSSIFLLAWFSLLFPSILLLALWGSWRSSCCDGMTNISAALIKWCII